MSAVTSIDLDAAIHAALARRPEASALACVDVDTGMVLASAARSAAARVVIASSTATSTSLAAMPQLEDEDAGDMGPPVDRSLVATQDWVQVHERVPGCGSIFVVGIAAAGANIGLLASCVRDVSSLLGTGE
jgi:hypothetical protein